MKKMLFSCLTAAIILVCSSCTPAGYPVEFGQTKISSPPKRVVCLGEQAASWVSYLGYGEFLVGAPEIIIESDKLTATDIGTPLNIYKETVVSLKPDLVITSFALESDFSNTLREKEVPVITFENPKDFKELEEYFKQIIKLFEGEKQTAKKFEEKNSAFNASVTEIKNQISGVQKNALVFLEEGFAATGDTFSGSVLKAFGIKNVGENGKNYKLSNEEVTAQNTDIIFCKKGMGDMLIKNEAFKDITAVKNAKVYEVDTTGLVVGGAKMFSAVGQITNYLKK